MIIDGKLPQGYVVICSHRHASRSFLVRRLGLSVECPACGRTALSTELAADFHRRPALLTERKATRDISFRNASVPMTQSAMG
jgi:hypothetical protein